MDRYYFVRGFGQSYGQSTYGSCGYNGGAVCNAAGESDSSHGLLNGISMMVSVIIAIACLVIFAGLVVRFWRRPAKVTVPAQENESKRQNDTK